MMVLAPSSTAPRRMLRTMATADPPDVNHRRARRSAGLRRHETPGAAARAFDGRPTFSRVAGPRLAAAPGHRPKDRHRAGWLKVLIRAIVSSIRVDEAHQRAWPKGCGRCRLPLQTARQAGSFLRLLRVDVFLSRPQAGGGSLRETSLVHNHGREAGLWPICRAAVTRHRPAPRNGWAARLYTSRQGHRIAAAKPDVLGKVIWGMNRSTASTAAKVWPNGESAQPHRQLEQINQAGADPAGPLDANNTARFQAPFARSLPRS